MKCVRVFVLALPLLLLALAIAAPAAKEQQTQYGIKVFNRVLSTAPGPAVVVSPYSLNAALGMLALGAEGATARLFRQQGITPHRSGPSPSPAAGSKADVTLQIANSAWLRTRSKPRPSFARSIRRAFGAKIATVDFSRPEAARRINAWVSAATQKVIPQVVDTLDPMTQFALVNTVYFKGKWASPFDKADTKTTAFARLDGTKRDVAMMNATRTLSYAETPLWHAVTIPYAGNRFAMVVATSKDASMSAAFKQEAAKQEFFQVLLKQASRETELALRLPRFKAEYGADLTPVLADLGLKRALGLEANYRRITTSPVRAIAVVHRAVVDVAEEGTEAAAATAVIGVRGIRQGPSITFAADHPFYFAITDTVTGTALFVGYVADPAP
jgi:serine protease inhibitor